MGDITTRANEAFRDYVTDGVPSSGAYEPLKSLIRTLFGIVDTQVSSAAGDAETAAAEAEAASATAEAAAAAALAAVSEIVAAEGLIFTTPFYVEGPGYCAFVMADDDDKPILAIPNAGGLWVLNPSTGYLVQVLGASGGAANDDIVLQTSSFTLPDGSLAAVYMIDVNDKPYFAAGASGIWGLVGGVLTLVAGVSTESYTGGSGRRTVYNNSEDVVDAQGHRFTDDNVVYGLYTAGQSLNGSNNDRNTFTGSISGTTLTVESAVVGEIRPLDRLFWDGIDVSIGATQTRIVEQLTSTTWEVTPSQTRASIAMEARDTARTITSTYPDNVLMSGIEGEDYGLLYPAGAEIDRLISGVELDVVFEDPESGYWKETGMVAMANELVRLCQIRLGYTPTFVLGGAATGGTPYRGHTRGSTNGTELRRIIQRHADILRADGKRLVVLGVRYRGSEENNKGNTQARESARHHCQLVEHLNIDIKRITGQAETVQLFANQCNRRTTSATADARAPLGPLMAMDLDPRINCTGSIYWGDPSSDKAHLRSWSYLALGVLDAHHVYGQCFDVGARPQRVRKAYRVAADKWRIDYELPVGLDAAIVDGIADAVSTNAGLLFQDGTGSPSQTVSSVAVIGGSQAAGTLTFTGVGVAGNTITIGEHTFTLVASGATGPQVNIGASAAATAQNVKTYINAHELECQVTASGASDVLTLTSRHNRNGGSIATTRTGTACAFGAATLTGGAFSYTLEVTLSGTPTGYDPRFVYATYSADLSMGNLTGPRGRVRAGVPLGVARDDRVAGGLVEVFDWACTETIRLGVAA